MLCDRLLTIVDNISDGVFSIDLDYRITFINKAAQKITGFSYTEAYGKSCKDILQTNVCDSSCPLKATLTSGIPIINKPVCLVNKKGKRVPISISTALLKDAWGNVVGGVETFRDLDLARQIQKEFESRFTFEDMISRNKEMQHLFEMLPIIAESGSSVMIEGESGTGKELIARALHNLSSRKSHPFIAVNCGALPDNLLESELFGYVAGAFTDAKKDKKGRFALAEKGTLFLDEIGNISPAMQVKLLRVLHDKEYEPLGGTETMRSDVRIITASNAPLDAMVENETFRADLFYRINVIKIVLPPLRERREDIPLLIDHFVDQFNRLRRKDLAGASPATLDILIKYDFPGNIRELENIIEHAFVICPQGIIKPEHLPKHLHADNAIPAVEIASTMKEMETLFLIAALKRNNWSRKETARQIGIDPSTLYRKIKKLKLKIPEEKDR
ncbi:MAG: sigma 54-interacting transcriptional regulator [candidate division Zixibacteria bacterium]|nr:sigma 54-interacting transcriptional regulator [candidate division Zixibacteria bacterium]